MTPLDEALTQEKYLSLVTWRKSGKAVPTPVWFALDSGKAYAFSMADSGKVKRLRNSAKSKVAACDYRGKVHGEWIATETVILANPADQEKARIALRRKYTISMWVSDVFGHLSGRIKRRAYLELTAVE